MVAVSDSLLRNLHIMIFVVFICLGFWPLTNTETLTHNMSVFIQQPYLHRASKIFTALQQCVGSHKRKGEETIAVLVSIRWLTRSQFIFIHSKSLSCEVSACPDPVLPLLLPQPIAVFNSAASPCICSSLNPSLFSASSFFSLKNPKAEISARRWSLPLPACFQAQLPV